jgi:uncharacterized iron-regulated membrane protein
MKKYIRKIHLWIGLATGLIFFIVCLSGALLSFTEEVFGIINKDYLFVPKQNLPKAKIEDVIANYQKDYPQEQVFVLNSYVQKNRSFDFFSAVKSGKKDLDGNDIFEGYKMVYANPYTSEIMKVDKGTLETIVILVQLHVNLFAGKIGNYIVKIGTIIFLIELIAGLYLWWPKTQNARKTAFKIKTGSGRKRLNYDLHRTLGFYTAIVLLVLTISGLIMAWPQIKGPVVDYFGGNSELLELEEFPQPERQNNVPDVSYNKLFDKLHNENPEVQQITFFPPQADSITAINGTIGKNIGFLNFETGQRFQFNRYTGEEMGGKDLKDFLKNSEVEAGLLLIHMGLWGGMTTKVITFICGMIGASLPITGFLIWRGRRKKKNRKELKLMEIKEA